ncbi:MAG: nucleotidyltransferase domain-containing protein [Desulfurococcaceae archaeon]|nr:nucleotidyltransferase domain-containing protein [Desulfurococcaceae archaeon]
MEGLFVFPGEDVKSFLRRVYEFLSELPNIIASEDVCSIVVFGSAARPSDFAPGVSDIDVLVLVRKAPKRRVYDLDFMDTRVHMELFTPEELDRMIEEGSPLGFMLRYSVVVLDRGCLPMIRSRPRITEYTIKVLRRSVLAALGLAVESYYIGMPRESASHLYHSVRHLIRYLYSLSGDAEGFPVSDEELLSRGPEDLRSFFKKLIEMRRRETDASELREAIEEAVELIARKLGLKKTGIDVLENLPDRPHMVVACENGDWLVFHVEIAGEAGLKKLRLRGSDVTEIESILCD